MTDESTLLETELQALVQRHLERLHQASAGDMVVHPLKDMVQAPATVQATVQVLAAVPATVTRPAAMMVSQMHLPQVAAHLTPTSGAMAPPPQASSV